MQQWQQLQPVPDFCPRLLFFLRLLLWCLQALLDGEVNHCVLCRAVLCCAVVCVQA
jgi:hypothetical protein